MKTIGRVTFPLIKKTFFRYLGRKNEVAGLRQREIQHFNLNTKQGSQKGTIPGEVDQIQF